MVEASTYKSAMALLPSAVSIVTTDGDSGRFGFTASSVCSVSDQPATLLVCLNRSSYSHSHFVANKVLAVNVLAASDQRLASVFASSLSSDERFSHASWCTQLSGAPILQGALMSFDCSIDHSHTVATHDVFFCRVLAIKAEADQGLVYFNRSFHRIGQEIVA